MDYNNEITLACTSGIKELEAILDYTQKLSQSEDDNMKSIYADNRRDELPHIQNLVIAITAMINGESPAIATQMDGDTADRASDDDTEVTANGKDT